MLLALVSGNGLCSSCINETVSGERFPSAVSQIAFISGNSLCLITVERTILCGNTSSNISLVKQNSPSSSYNELGTGGSCLKSPQKKKPSEFLQTNILYFLIGKVHLRN